MALTGGGEASRVSLMENVSAAPAIADHFQPVVVEPAAAETDLSTARRKRPAADRATLDLRPLRAGPLADVPVRTLGKSAALRGCRLRAIRTNSNAPNNGLLP